MMAMMSSVRLVARGAAGLATWRSLSTAASEALPPARIILVRHGESMGNVSEETYATTPDWKISLTDKGREQARQAGSDLKALLSSSGEQQSVVTYCSPYQRTLQTWQEIESALTETGTPEATSEDTLKLDEEMIIGMRQEPRLAEQQFGNFQNPKKTLDAKQERHLFGRFFFRFPNGESGMDVYSRVTSFLGSLTRDTKQLQGLGVATKNVNVLCVTHGLTLRLFVMRYFQLTVEEFEETYNPPNAKLVVLERQYSEENDSFYFRLQDDSKKLLNLHGDVSTKVPVFWRNRFDEEQENP